jgi:serine/threonine protein kinase
MGNCCSECHKALFGRVQSGYEVIADPVGTSSRRRNGADRINESNNNSVTAPYQAHPINTTVSPAYSIRSSPDYDDKSNIAPVTTYPSYQQPRQGFFIKYDLREEIGVGSTSKCYSCTRKSDAKVFACKVIDKRQIESQYSGMLDQCTIEIKVLKTLNHPNIIKLEDNYETPDRIFMVMEKMQGGELFDYVVEKGTLSEEEGSLLVRKITSAVAHMHALNIIHRDLKPENLLLTTKGPDAEVKLIDFGLAKIMDDAVAKSFLGTRGYLAPEMLQRHAYDKAVDIWALGVIVFVLLCGCLPFDDDSSRIDSESAARKKFTLRFPRWSSNLSVSAKDLLHNLLDVNPKTRFTAEQALNHPWVSGRTVQINNYLQSPSQLGKLHSSFHP